MKWSPKVLRPLFNAAALTLGCAAMAGSAPKPITAAETALFQSLASIGFESSDDRVAVRKADLARAVRHFNAGRRRQGLAALDQVDAAMPVEVADFASWPLRDIAACTKAPNQRRGQNQISCAFAFETGKASCAQTAAMNKSCVDYFCGSEMLKPAYEKAHKSYLDSKQTQAVLSAIRIVSAHCPTM